MTAKQQLRDRIEALSRHVSKLDDTQGIWTEPSEEDLRKVVLNMRTNLKATGLNPAIIDSGNYGMGYRVGLPLDSILLSVTTPEWRDVVSRVTR